MYRFFVEERQIEPTRIHITGNDVNHIKNVLRMKPGEEILVSAQGNLEYKCYIETLSEEEVTAVILYAMENNLELPASISLFQGLPKGDKMEFIIQKAVELGVHEVIPVASRRCVVKLDEKKAKNKVARWQGISESAAKQSKRMIVPQVRPVMKYEEALEYARSLDMILIPYELAKGMKHTRELFASIRPGQSVGIFIGPEGGFEEEEVKKAVEAGAEPITLGRRILRTETAGMTVLSILMYLMEEE